jgi:peptide/nickel transport system permease protein
MFTLIHLMPGGPDQVIFNPRMSAATRAIMRTRFGLDDPVYIQYFKWLSRALTGDFGFSFVTNQNVLDVIQVRLWATVQLYLVALSLSLVVAIFLGTLSAVRQGTMTDYALTFLSYFGLSMPIFLFAILGQWLFGVQLHWLPVSGMETEGVTYDPLNGLLDHFLHMILPVMVLSLTFVAGWSRFMRASMIETVKQDYMRTAKAKGVSQVSALFKHALRNAIIPLVTVVALNFGAIAGGATITEGIFAWPGTGSLFFSSLEARDYPVLLALLILGAVFVIVFNLVADILYGVMDPRIRYS